MTSGQPQISARDGPGGPRRRRSVWGHAAWPALALLAFALAAFSVATHLGDPARRTLVVASIPYWNIQHGTNVVLANRTAVNEVSPWIYGLTATGAIVPQYSPGQASAVTADIARLRAAHLSIVPSIANITGGAWDYPAVAHVLHNPVIMRQQVDAIVGLVQREKYAGIDIDYEELHAGDRQAFTQFATDLAAALHAHGKVLSIAVFPQTAAPAPGQPSAAQDYAALGRVADQVRVMAYNYHWANSAPGATAPIAWVRAVMRYATSQMPASKVVLGVPLFGYDWSSGTGSAAAAPATTVSWLQALRLSRQYHVSASYSKAAQAPFFSYVRRGRKHTVWFENAASSTAMFQVAKGSGAAGVYLWMYGYEDPGTWPSLRTVLPISGSDASSTSSVVPLCPGGSSRCSSSASTSPSGARSAWYGWPTRASLALRTAAGDRSPGRWPTG
ncbi:MAG TPA: glycosyl hydrolase family 18 protein [Streptosporangiaceae bacterium]|nr:glycosyl hydrolase family 18 protein [Streptosporangiaceae bacterium]